MEEIDFRGTMNISSSNDNRKKESSELAELISWMATVWPWHTINMYEHSRSACCQLVFGLKYPMVSRKNHRPRFSMPWRHWRILSWGARSHCAEEKINGSTRDNHGCITETVDMNMHPLPLMWPNCAHANSLLPWLSRRTLSAPVETV